MEAKEKKPRAQTKSQIKLNELIRCAELMQIEVRTEKLLREVGYRVASGSCRLHEKKIIILDRDLPIRDQVDFLAGEIKRAAPDSSRVPSEFRELLQV